MAGKLQIPVRYVSFIGAAVKWETAVSHHLREKRLCQKPAAFQS